MRIVAKASEQLQIPPEVEPYCRQAFITGGKEYEVHAIVARLHSPCMILFQIIDDSRYPSWLPHVLFEIADGTVAPDWCCNILNGVETNELRLLVGPEFLVKDIESYNAMLELEADQVDLFWKRVESIKKAREEQRWLEELDRQEGESE